MLPENQSPDEADFDYGDFPVSGIISIEFSGNLVVIKTRPGFANGIASVIDSQAPYEILGTIAGDDTFTGYPRISITYQSPGRPLAVSAGIRDKILG